MSRAEKIYHAILTRPQNIHFDDFCHLLESFGFFIDRTKGSHYIYKKDGIPEFINIQNYRNKVKPYQVRQFIKLIEKYGLKMHKGTR